MVRETGCDGVVVGRGCLGRPWLFADLAAAFAGMSERARPTLGGGRRDARAARPLSGGLPRRRRAAGLPGHPQAHRLVPQGIPRRAANVRHQAGAGRQLGGARRAGRPAGWRLRRGPGPTPRGSAGGRAAPKAVTLPDGWLNSRDLDADAAAALRRAVRREAGGVRWLSEARRPPSRRLHRCGRRALGPRAAQGPAPGRLRARPGPRPALLGAAPARGQDPGGGPGDGRLRPQPAHPHPRGRPDRPRARRGARAATPTSSTPRASPTTSGIRPSGTTARRALDDGRGRRSAASRATPRPCALLTRLEPKAVDPTTGRPRASTSPGPASTPHEVPVGPRRQGAGRHAAGKFGVYDDDLPTSSRWLRDGRPGGPALRRGAGDGPAPTTSPTRCTTSRTRSSAGTSTRGLLDDPDEVARIVEQVRAWYLPDVEPTARSRQALERLRAMPAWVREFDGGAPGPRRAEGHDQPADRAVHRGGGGRDPGRGTAAGGSPGTRADVVVPRATLARDHGAQGHRRGLRDDRREPSARLRAAAGDPHRSRRRR